VSAAEIRIIALKGLDLRFEPRAWPWAEANKNLIARYFAQERGKKPALWNGRVLVLHRFAVEDEVFRGAFLETDFANFLTWRDVGFPDPTMRGCFAAGALRAADGAFLLGRMGSHTANAGKVYFPAGTPDPRDVQPDGSVDLMGSVERELMEETGLSPDDVSFGPRWRAVIAGGRVGLIRPLRARLRAEELAARMRAFIAGEKESELDDVVVIRGPADLVPAIPDYIRAYLESEWNA